MSRTYSPNGASVRMAFMRAFARQNHFLGATLTTRAILKQRKIANRAGWIQDHPRQRELVHFSGDSNYGLDPSISADDDEHDVALNGRYLDDCIDDHPTGMSLIW